MKDPKLKAALPPQRQLVTRKEAARMLGVHEITIRRREKEKSIKTVRFSPNGKVFIEIAELEAFIKRRKDSG